MFIFGLRFLVFFYSFALFTPAMENAQQCRHLFEQNPSSNTLKDRLFALFGSEPGVYFFNYTFIDSSYREGHAKDQWLTSLNYPTTQKGALRVEIVHTDAVQTLKLKFLSHPASIGHIFRSEVVFEFDPSTGEVIPTEQRQSYPVHKAQQASRVSRHMTAYAETLHIQTKIQKGPLPDLLNASMLGVTEDHFSWSLQNAPSLEWRQSYHEEVYTDKSFHQREGVRTLELTPAVP